jgi:hypothetical protein
VNQPALLCPSAQPDMPGAKVHGVVDPASGRVLYLDVPVAATPELLATTSPLLPTEVLRFSAPCQGSICAHFADSACTLGDRLVHILPASSAALPSCAIRPTCRWFRQQGGQACARCDNIVTDEFSRSAIMAALADPQAPFPFI